MCGRYTLTAANIGSLLDLFRATPVKGTVEFSPRYNVAPGQPVLCVSSDAEGDRTLAFFLWGFVPPWVESGRASFGPQANIRDDTIKKNAFFSNQLRTSRCIFVADGFYEWKALPGSRGKARKTPFYFSARNGGILPLAGLWRHARMEGQERNTAAIITTSPNSLVGNIHDRMPVILRSAGIEIWLDNACTDPGVLNELIAPFPSEELSVSEVSTLVNNSRNDSPDCIRSTRSEERG